MYICGEPKDIGTYEGSSETFRNRFIGLTNALCGAGAAAKGVSQDGGDDGDMIPVATSGIPLVEAGDQTTPIINGSEIASDTTGRAVVAVAEDVIIGHADVPSTQSAIAEGSLVRVKLFRGDNVKAAAAE